MQKQFKLWLGIKVLYLFKTNLISADSSTTLFYGEKLADSDDNLGSITYNTVIQLLLFFFLFYIESWMESYKYKDSKLLNIIFQVKRFIRQKNNNS